MLSKSRKAQKPGLASDNLTSQARERLQKAVALHQQGQLAQAEALYAEVLRTQPKNHYALHLSGVIALQKHDLQRAVDLIGKAIEIHPHNGDFYSNHGNALIQLNRFEEAVQSYEKAVAIQPDDAQAHYNKGNALKKLKRLDAAVQSYDQTIAVKPDFAEAHLNRGNALRELNQFDAALQSYEKAIDIKPDYAEAYYGRGLTLKKLKRLDAAVHSFDKVITIKPDYVAAHAERGNALVELKQLDAAVQSYSSALSHAPDHPNVMTQKSFVLLLMGEFDMGWRLYEWRWKCDRVSFSRRQFSQPLWLGDEKLKGKTILLHSEQGMGDTLQFCRYAKLVSGLGAQVILEVPKPLVGLLAMLDGIFQVVEQGAVLPSFDFHCPLMSLPFAFKTDIQSIPSEPKYLAAPASKVAFWQERLGLRKKPLVGLAWSGSHLHKSDSNRSIVLSDFVRQLPSGFQYISLQKEVRDADRATLQLRQDILHVGDEIADFTDTAALCELMDVVISVDTSVVHLSGALGKRTWVLLPFVPDWRWLLDRNDSPWYPSVKLYRQSTIGDWDTVLASVFADLKTAF